jgi:hypothetical protein
MVDFEVHQDSGFRLFHKEGVDKYKSKVLIKKIKYQNVLSLKQWRFFIS